MGRASRLKTNPDRDAYRREKMRAGAGSYLVAPGRTLEEMARAVVAHEAGHITIAFALGLEIHYAIVTCDEVTCGGYTELRYRFDDGLSRAEIARVIATPAMLRKRTIQTLAGQRAESLVNRDYDDIGIGATNDNAAADQFATVAAYQLGEPASKFTADCFEACDALLVSNMDAFNRIAQCLSEHWNENVDGELLRAVFDGGVSATLTRSNAF